MQDNKETEPHIKILQIIIGSIIAAVLIIYT